MVFLIVLNIILIILLVFLVLYIIKNNKDVAKNICKKDNVDDKVESGKHKHNKKIKKERVFVGRFVTDDEYQQMIENRKSNISILLENIDMNYEHLKELNK